MPNDRWWTEDPWLERRLAERRSPRSRPASPLHEALLRWQRERPQSLSLLNVGGPDAERRRQEGRRFLEERLGWPRETSIPDARTLHREEHQAYERQELRLKTVSGLDAPATLLLPKGVSGPVPGIVALHDMGTLRAFGREKLLAFEGEPAYLSAFRESCYDGVSLMASLAGRGYAVIAIDAINFGERTSDAMADPEGFKNERLDWDEAGRQAFQQRAVREHEPLWVRNVMAVGRTWPGLIVAEDRRTLDYLAGRPEVDENRLGCIGLSFGAYRANFLAAVDERVRAAVSVCWSSAMDGMVGYNVGGGMGWFSLVPGLFEQMDLPDVQALTAPRALMAISGWQDQLMQPFGIAQAHRHLRRCFENFGCPEQLASLVYDTPHEFNRSMQGAAVAWLDEKLA